MLCLETLEYMVGWMGRMIEQAADQSSRLSDREVALGLRYPYLLLGPGAARWTGSYCLCSLCTGYLSEWAW
jgi:hypothetical protein